MTRLDTAKLTAFVLIGLIHGSVLVGWEAARRLLNDAW